MKKIYKSGLTKCPKCGERMIPEPKKTYDYCRDADCNWCQFHIKDKTKWVEVTQNE